MRNDMRAEHDDSIGQENHQRLRDRIPTTPRLLGNPTFMHLSPGENPRGRLGNERYDSLARAQRTTSMARDEPQARADAPQGGRIDDVGRE